MLSVFITPCMKPTACHCAIRPAVRSVTACNRAAAGLGALWQSG